MCRRELCRYEDIIRRFAQRNPDIDVNIYYSKWDRKYDICAENKKFSAKEQMKSMGWKEGEGLGRNSQGIKQPITANDNKNQRGLGYQHKIKWDSNAWWFATKSRRKDQDREEIKFVKEEKTTAVTLLVVTQYHVLMVPQELNQNRCVTFPTTELEVNETPEEAVRRLTRRVLGKDFRDSAHFVTSMLREDDSGIKKCDVFWLPLNPDRAQELSTDFMFWAVCNELVNKPAEDWNSDETDGKELRVYEEEEEADKRLIFLEKLIDLQENLEIEESEEAFDKLYLKKMQKVIKTWHKEEENEMTKKLRGKSIGPPEHEMKIQ